MNIGMHGKYVYVNVHIHRYGEHMRELKMRRDCTVKMFVDTLEKFYNSKPKIEDLEQFEVEEGDGVKISGKWYMEDCFEYVPKFVKACLDNKPKAWEYLIGDCRYLAMINENKDGIISIICDS